MNKRILSLLVFALFTAILAGCGSDPLPPEPATAAPPTALPSATPLSEPSRLPTSTPQSANNESQEVINIAALGRLYGLIRYFHPSDQAAAVEQWDNVLMNGIEAVREARNPAELAAQLNDYFAPIAPTVHVYLADGDAPEGIVSLPDSSGALEVVMWEHFGVQADENRSPYTSKRVHSPLENDEIYEGFRDPRQPLTAAIGGGLAAAVPVALFQDNGGTYPAVLADSAALEADNAFDSQTRYLAGGIMYWSIIRHFYPYLDVIDADWDAVLAPALAQTLAAENETALEEALFRLVAQSQDGHGSIQNSSVESLRIPRIHTDWVENQLVVVEDQRITEDPLPPGTTIVTIDGLETQTRMENLKQFLSGATDQWLVSLAKNGLLAGPSLSELTLDIRLPDGAEETIIVQCTDLPTTIQDNTRPSMIEELSTGIFYIDLTRVNDSQMFRAMDDLETASGIIFDMRGYPGEVSTDFIQNLITEAVSSAQFLVPQTRLPNQEEVTFFDGGWEIVQRRPKLTDNIVFLTDGSAISYAETLMGIVEHYQLGEIVGQPTAGTNGNINAVDLPTGHRVYWTGMLVLKHDGSQHHGVGILPTVPVSPTIEGIIAGRDEQLEAALALLEEG